MTSTEEEATEAVVVGRISDDEYLLTKEQIDTFHNIGCVTIENVLNEAEIIELQIIFDKFVNRDIIVPGKDFCDISKPYGVPYEEWSLVNCMLPTTYYPPMQNNIFERLTASMAKQLFPTISMKKDYDQLLNKRPGKKDAIFAWHQDMGYWPGSKALGLDENQTQTCTFSLAIDDSLEENGCLRYIPKSGVAKKLRNHRPLVGNKDSGRDEGHALTIDIDPNIDPPIELAIAKSGSITIHDEWIIHGSGGNTTQDKQRRTYVIAYRASNIVNAERSIGFTHSHNDDVNWDNFNDGESHRIKNTTNTNTNNN